MFLTTDIDVIYMCEWANQNVNEPTLNVARVQKSNVPRSKREERQSKVDALVAIQAAGER